METGNTKGTTGGKSAMEGPSLHKIQATRSINNQPTAAGTLLISEKSFYFFL
jgi:hypothetical protein